MSCCKVWMYCDAGTSVGRHGCGRHRPPRAGCGGEAAEAAAAARSRVRAVSCMRGECVKACACWPGVVGRVSGALDERGSARVRAPPAAAGTVPSSVGLNVVAATIYPLSIHIVLCSQIDSSVIIHRDPAAPVRAPVAAMIRPRQPTCTAAALLAAAPPSAHNPKGPRPPPTKVSIHTRAGTAKHHSCSDSTGARIVIVAHGRVGRLGYFECIRCSAAAMAARAAARLGPCRRLACGAFVQSVQLTPLSRALACALSLLLL